MPAWATFDTTTGRLAGTPSTSHIGLYTGIRILLRSGQTFISLPQFSIEVLPANRPPTIGGTPAASVTVGRSYSFTPTASDADGDALTFSISGKPAWASFSSSTGRLSGSPSSSRVGSYPNIVITVSDGKASAPLGPFSIEVRAANTAPTIAGTPADAAQAGTPYAFTPVASDVDGQALTFSISGRPAWASFDSATGTLAGTPTTAHIGVHSNIVISVSDGLLSASLPPFSITVQVLDRQQAGVGELRDEQRSHLRHARIDARRHVLGHPHLGVGRHHDGRAAGILDHGRPCGADRLRDRLVVAALDV